MGRRCVTGTRARLLLNLKNRGLMPRRGGCLSRTVPSSWQSCPRWWAPWPSCGRHSRRLLPDLAHCHLLQTSGANEISRRSRSAPICWQNAVHEHNLRHRSRLCLPCQGQMAVGSAWTFNTPCRLTLAAGALAASVAALAPASQQGPLAASAPVQRLVSAALEQGLRVAIHLQRPPDVTSDEDMTELVDEVCVEKNVSAPAVCVCLHTACECERGCMTYLSMSNPLCHAYPTCYAFVFRETLGSCR